ncbi:Sperm-associated antigen 7 [Orchesella cincta]|uniref:Sperm-associated antigen 7 n=1 Tax=Orchesella cincta TaxID=48709 RepID=A0A1D2MDX3_ORCCI|nr:Sperm-associated antigen 7 [Orchesella cincta]
MDILGSIMKKMEKPPVMGEKERKLKKMQQDILKKEQEAKEKRVQEFRKNMAEEIKKFVEDEGRTRHVFPPMDKPYRSMLYTMAEDAGLTAHSFGREELDRHVMVFKENHVPCDAEMSALRRGEVYVRPLDGEVGAVEEQDSGDDDDVPQKTRRSRNAPPPEYLQKYQKHLGGMQFAKEDAIKAQADNRSYGFVSSEQKRDKRTIEETLADIRARKKQKPDSS